MLPRVDQQYELMMLFGVVCYYCYCYCYCYCYYYYYYHNYNYNYYYSTATITTTITTINTYVRFIHINLTHVYKQSPPL